MAETNRRESDQRLDNIEQMITKIHTVLIGNGVKGLVQRHEDLTNDVRKIDNTVKRFVYGGGGIMLCLTLILNIDKVIGVFTK